MPLWKKILRATLAPMFRHIVDMPGKTYEGNMPSLGDDDRQLRKRLVQHVMTLSFDYHDRHLQSPALDACARWLNVQLEGLGFSVKWQPFKVDERLLYNLEIEVPGTSRADEIIVVGAHYDTFKGCPGADDNATGVAAVMELARMFKDKKPDRTIRFCLFAHEESHNYPDRTMGSYHYARWCKQSRHNIVAMLSLEMIGYYSDMPGSQKYPFPFNAFYPDTGNFLGFIGNTKSRSLVRDLVKSFRANTKFPCEGVAAPSWLKDAARSDNWSFWHFGYPAVMVTDTSNFRFPYLHTAEDTADKLDFDRMTQAVIGIARLLEEMARGRLPRPQTV